MGTNHYFNNNPNTVTSEQLLIEDLFIESIKIWGTDAYYLPRTNQTNTETDYIYGENKTSIFREAIGMEMYISRTTDFGGRNDFFSKMGLQIEDETKVILARRTFQKYAPRVTRPMEGDLIYIPTFGKLFEITFVNEDKRFYTLGRKKPLFYYFEITLQAFKFNNERIATGNLEIDNIGANYSYTIQLNLGAGTGNYITNEIVTQGDASATVKWWDRSTQILSVINITGTFANGANVTGATSNAVYTIGASDPLDLSGVLEQLADNKEIQEEADEIIDFSEDNPFGEP